MHTRQAIPAFWILLLSLVLSGLWACAPEPAPVPTPWPPTPTMLPLAAPTPTLPAAAPEPPACLTRPGRLLAVELDSAPIPRFHIYLPACYETLSRQRFPVLYLFHGQGYADDQWPRLGAAAAADQLIAAGEAAPFIIVMPYDQASWRSPQYDQFDRAVLAALIPYVDASYRTLAERPYRAVGGLSRGAGWALRLGLTHPDLFGAVGLHSPVIFYADQGALRGWLADLPAGAQPSIYIDIGQSDREHGNARYLADLLDAYEVPHVWQVHSGNHDEDYWQAHVEDYLRWYASNLAGERLGEPESP